MFKSYHPEIFLIINEKLYINIMLGLESLVSTVDNSGLNKVKCLKFLRGKKNNKHGHIGTMIITSVYSYKKKSKIKKDRKIFLGVLVTAKQWFRRKIGFYIKSNKNQILLLENEEKFIGTAIKGPLPLELRKFKKMNKIISAAKTLY